MVKEEFYYDSRDAKSKLHAVRYLPDGMASPAGPPRENPAGASTEQFRKDPAERPRCIVQIVHGMAEYIERYEEFARFLTDRGVIVTGEDHMGHGKSVGEAGKCGYFCDQDPATVLVRDVHRLKKLTQALYPDLPYVILGHSMGSFIVRNYMFRYGTGISGAVIMGTGMQSPALLSAAKAAGHIQRAFCGQRHVSGLLNLLAFGGYNGRIGKPATPFDWLSRDAERVERYIADPMCGFTFTINGFLTLFELISRLNRRENLERVPGDLPVLMVSGDADPVGDYGKGVQRAYESLRDAGVRDISLKMYAGGRHELVNETNRDEVMEDIFRWIGEKVPGGGQMRGL